MRLFSRICLVVLLWVWFIDFGGCWYFVFAYVYLWLWCSLVVCAVLVGLALVVLCFRLPTLGLV